MKISILGGGAFGSALSLLLSEKVSEVAIWEYDAALANQMQQSRVSTFLPGFAVPANVHVTSEISVALQGTDMVVFVVPSHTFAATALQVSKYISSQPIIICSKGLGDSQELLSDLAKQYLSGDIYCLYGPTLANEVASKKLTGLVLAGNKIDLDILSLFQTDYTRVDASDDIVGVQIASALKNVVTIFVGIIEGGELGDNTKSFIFTRGLEDIKKVGVALGGKQQSFYGFTGLGDMLLHSRNRMFGQEIGKGKSVDELVKQSGHTLEGLVALKHIRALAQKLKLELQVIEGLYKILYEKVDVVTVLKSIT